MAIGADSLALLFKIRADSGDAKRELSSLSTHAKKESNEIKAAINPTFSPWMQGLLRDSKQAQAGFTAFTTAAKKEVESLTGSFSNLLSPTNLLAGGAVALGVALFGAAKEAMDLGGQLFDLSQKTNFAVETLSALRNAGQTAGVELNSISSALGIFDKNLAKAKTGTDDTSKTIRSMNLNLADNEAALRQAFQALIKMPEGAEQTALAMQLFGRSGKDVLGVLKEMDGDLDKAIAQYREMGTLMDTETAKAADELGDSITAVGQGALGLGKDLLGTLAPALKVIIGLFDILIKAAKGWLIVINAIADNKIGRIAQGLQNEAQAKFFEGVSARREGIFGGLLGSLQTPAPAAPEDVTGGAGLPGGIFRGGGGRGGAARAATPKKTADDYGLDLVERLKEQLTMLNATSGAVSKVNAEITNLERQYGKLGTVVREQILTGARLVQTREMEKKVYGEMTGFLEKQAEAVRQLTEGDKSHYRILLDQIDLWDRQGFSLNAVNLQLSQYRALLLDVGRIAEANAKLGVDVGGMFGGATSGAEIIPEGSIGNVIGKVLGEPPPPPDFSAHISALTQLRDIGVDAANGMADAFGNLAQQWVLTGQTGPAAMRKILASALASIAAEAAVRSLFELARGFAALFTNPAEAAAHFQSSALFAAVAGASAIAGRAVAGNAFQQSANESSRGGGGGGRSGGSSQSNNASLAVNRPVDPTVARLSETVDKLAGVVSRLTSASPGSVLIAGARESPDAVGDTWVQQYSRRPTLKRVIATGGIVAD